LLACQLLIIMSSDIACVPPWKVALMERKRRQDKDIVSSGSRQEQLDVNGLPSWKRDILVKKQHAKNTFVFMAKSTIRDVDSDRAESSAEQLDPVASYANGHTGLTEFNKQHSSTPNAVSVSASSEFVNTRNSTQNSTGGIDNDEMDDRPVEERLLPIHRNPILRLDIEKRYNSTSQTVRSSLSPRGGSEHTGSHDQTPTIEEANLVYSPQVFCRSDSECDVFTTEETSSDSEVTYGRGFVHKLLMKFSHLAATDQSAAVHVPPLKQSLSSSSQSRSSTGSPGCSLGKISLADSDGLLKQTNLVTSRAKCRSVDDLLRDSERRFSQTDFLENVAARNCGHVITHHGNGDFDSMAKPAMPVRRSSMEDAEELPISNIVSSTRSLFENLVTSPRLSKAAVPHSNSFNRFSHIDTSDKTKSKSGEFNLPVATTLDRDPLSVPNIHNGLETKVNNHTAVKHNNVEAVKFVTNSKENMNGNGSHLDVVDAMQLSAVRRPQSSDNLQMSNRVEDVDTSRTEEIVHTHSIKIPTTNGYRINSQSHKHETDIAQDVLPKLSHSQSSSELKASDKSEVMKNNHVVVNGKSSHSFGNNHDRLESVLMKNEIAASSASVSPIHATQNEILKSSTSTSLKDNTVRNSHDAWHSTNGENNSWGAGSSTNTAQKAGPSRPGKLLIRPASNLVAAKTNTEYLALTKYNDVRKGEFAPAAKKSIEQVIDDESVVDGDIVYTPAGVDIKERTIVFAGAGISLNRSLLNKSRQGKRVSSLLTCYFVYYFHVKFHNNFPAD